MLPGIPDIDFGGGGGNGGVARHHHHVSIGREEVDKRREFRVTNLHRLKMSR